MPLQSSGIIVVDKTSVITAAPTSSSVSAASGRPNGIVVGTSATGGGGVGSGGGVAIQNHIIHEWADSDTVHTVNTNNAANNHNLIRHNQRTISGSAGVQNTKTTITTIPLSNHTFSANQMNQINQQQIHHHHQQHQQQQQQQSRQQHSLQSNQPNQVIVSEEFLEHSNFGNNPNAAASANVINLTANDLVNQTQIIKLVSDGNGGNMLIDSLGNVTNGGHIHPNSKLLVGNLTNLTVLSKQSNSAGGQQTINFLNAKGLSYVTTKSQAQTQGIQKIVNLPLKSNNLVKASTISQQQIHHHITGTNVQQNGNATMVQKVTVPRSVQVVTRVQTLAPSSPQQQQQQQQLQQQQHQQSAQQQLQHGVHNNQVIMQQKYIHNIVSTGNVTAKVNNVGTIKKQILNQSTKVTQQKVIGQSLKTFAHQQSQQQHQQFQTVGVAAQATHTTIKPLKSQKVVRKIVGKNTTINTNAKYIMQSPLVLSNTPGNQLINTKLSNNNNTGNIVVPQQIINTINNSVCVPPGNSGAIKFVNAHGTVLQSQQNQPTIQTLQQQSNQQQKVRSQINKQQQNNQNQQPTVQQQQHYNEATTAVMTNEGIFIPAYVNNSQTASNSDEIMINGTQMTEEMSARILQSLSQKSIYNNMRQYQQVQQPQQQQLQQQPQAVQQHKMIQQHQQSPQTTNIVFESSSREYSVCKPAVAQQQQQQSQHQHHQQQIHHQQQQQHQQHHHHHQSQQQKLVSANVVYDTGSRDYGITKSVVHQQQQQQQQKIVQQSAISTNVVFEPSNRAYPICKPATIQQQQHLHQQHQQQLQHQHQQQHLQQSHASHVQFNGKYVTGGGGRTQSLDRKHGSQASKRSTDFFKVNTTEIQTSHSASTTFIDNIPLPCPLPRGDNAPATQQAEHEDDIIGEEVRPVPVITHDARLQALHAVQQDHTYVAAMPTRFPLELYQQQQQPQQQQQQQQQHQQQHQQQQQQQQQQLQLQQHQQQVAAAVQQQQQQQQLNIAAAGATSVATMSNGVYSTGCIIGQSAVGGNTGNTSMQLSKSIGPLLTGSLTCSNLSSASGFPYGQSVNHHQNDDDANSVISNESRTGHDGLDNDLGEETETAPEAEAEDSVTRCICDLTHDDGYMICCDKCSAWQHVDCMGIDRQNIPDEYLCSICQPRPVDRARAKSLQLLKRKEQQQNQSILNAQMNAANPTAGIIPDGNAQFLPLVGGSMGQDRVQPLMVNTTGVNTQQPTSFSSAKKGKLVFGKKKELLKRVKKDRASSKRRESKRTTKRKTKTSASNSDMNPSEKHAMNLRQWIENYELAMTNHYSPELRARLHAIGKQSPFYTEQNMTRNANLENKCTTVPHAGGKILISNFDIQPNSPIVELRGKYMLTTQYKNQNPSINMNLQPPNCLQNLKNQKTPGPFIFFHKLANDGLVGGPEICVDTRTYGNEARFVRRSCRPNAEIQHSFEKGTIHLYIVSLTNIMASTEITIKHEPHDLAALENKNLNFSLSPTSTICACGLTKDCQFGNYAIASAVVKPNNKKTVLNGTCSSEGNQQQLQQQLVVLGKNTLQNNISRGRSTSSSGESNAGLLSPNNNFATNIYSTSSISSLMHDSGVYTSSSSPSVSLPSPTHIQAINSPPQQTNHNQQITVLQSSQHIEPPIVSTSTTTSPGTVMPTAIVSVPTPAKSPQKCNAQNRKTPVKHPRNNSVSEDSSSQTAPSVPAASGGSSIASSQPKEEKRESRKLTREERKMEAIVRAFEKMEKNQQRKQELKQARTSSTGSSSGKRRNSSSPSPKRVKSQSISETDVRLDAVQNQQEPQLQQQQEQHQQRQEQAQPHQEQAQPHQEQQQQQQEQQQQQVQQQQQHQQYQMQHARKTSSTSLPRKKKRKSSKSYQIQSSSQRKRRRSRVNSNDSDMITSEESTSLLSPPLSRTISLPASLPSPKQIAERQKCLVASLSLDSQMQQNHHHHQLQQQEPPLPPLQPFQQPPTTNDQSNVNQAAGLLLAFAATTEQQDSMEQLEESECKSPIRLPQQIPEQRTPQTPPIVSSTCMLVEAAVGPLEGLEVLGSNEFKLPTKTKTKKSIMNDWLNQSNEFQQDYQQSCNAMEEEHQHQQTMENYHHQQQQQQMHIQQQMQIQQQIQMQQQMQIQQQQSLQSKSLETLVQAAATICEFRRSTSSPASFMMAQSHDEPENLSMVAKKVQEFINQSDVNFICNEEIKCESNSVEPSSNSILPIQVLHNNNNNNNNNNCSGSSSVKKRWLRQAISEECSDELAANFSASSPTQMYVTPNGFTTPLKKRRVIRECTDAELITSSPEDLSMTKSFSETSLVAEEIMPINKVEIEEKVDDKSQIKQEVCDAEDEVDILNSPSPDEKLIATDDVLVKIEPEDDSTEIKVDVEKEENSSNDVIKKTETIEQSCIAVVIKEIKSESPVHCPAAKLSAVAATTKTEVALKTEEAKEIPKTEPPIKLEPVKVETENFNSVTDEIADIQKRLHSFHTENIRVLQSRNKSKISRSVKQEPVGGKNNKKPDSKSDIKPDLKPDIKSNIKSAVVAAASKVSDVNPKTKTKKKKPEVVKVKQEVKKEERRNKSTTKRKNATSETITSASKKTEEQQTPSKSKSSKKKMQQPKMETLFMPEEITVKVEPKEAKNKNEIKCKPEPPPLVPSSIKEETLKIDEKHLQAALTIPNFNQNVTASPISNYVMNNAATIVAAEQTYETLLTAGLPQQKSVTPPLAVAATVAISSTTSVPQSILGVSQPPPLHLPYYYNTIYGKLIDKPAGTTAGLSSLSSLSSTPNLLLSDYMDSTKTKSLATLGGYVPHSNLFGLNAGKTALLTASIATTIATTSTTSSTSDATTSGCASKILTRTASHDPRLNPILTVPEPPPAPKRKLSINEYRKRMQLTSESCSGQQGSGNDKLSNNNSNSQSSLSSGSSLENCEKHDSTSNSNDESYSAEKISEVTNVQFSPAPTLLEQQQEIICERLKSLKNKSAVGSSLCSSTLSGITSGVSTKNQLLNDTPSLFLLLSSSSTPLTTSVSTTNLSSSSSLLSTQSTNVNCFSTSTSSNKKKDEFSVSRRHLRTSTSSLDSISSTSSSRRSSSYREITPTPQQCDIESPKDVTVSGGDAVGVTTDEAVTAPSSSSTSLIEHSSSDNTNTDQNNDKK